MHLLRFQTAERRRKIYLRNIYFIIGFITGFLVSFLLAPIHLITVSRFVTFNLTKYNYDGKDFEKILGAKHIYFFFLSF